MHTNKDNSQKIHIFVPQIGDLKDPANGYFIAVRLENFSSESVEATTRYRRKDFFKISLVTGNATYYYRDRDYSVSDGQCMLVFTNQEIPYRWEVHDGVCKGYACMFTQDFLPVHTYARPADWGMFTDQLDSVFYLNESQAIGIRSIFENMLAEQEGSYHHKYQVLFLYVLECIHFAMKLGPLIVAQNVNASARLCTAFKTLLSSQFPLIDPETSLEIRNPQDFANILNVHTNTLNRAIKTVTGKTTRQLITERLMQESVALLNYSNWSIAQIAFALGFEEQTHFARAFKTYYKKTPSSFRN